MSHCVSGCLTNTSGFSARQHQEGVGYAEVRTGRDSPAVEFAALGEAHTGVPVVSQGTALRAGQYFALFRLFAIICRHGLMLQWMELPSVQTVS